MSAPVVKVRRFWTSRRLPLNGCRHGLSRGVGDGATVKQDSETSVRRRGDDAEGTG